MNTLQLLLLFLIAAAFLHGEHLTFNDLEKNFPVESKNVTIRGFLYQGKDGHLILSNEPNLKSCCIGSKDKRYTQILVTGNFEGKIPLTAVTLQGELYAHDKDKTSFLYRLDNALLATENPIGLTWGGLLVGIGITLFAIFLRKK